MLLALIQDDLRPPSRCGQREKPEAERHGETPQGAHGGFDQWRYPKELSKNGWLRWENDMRINKKLGVPLCLRKPPYGKWNETDC